MHEENTLSVLIPSLCSERRFPIFPDYHVWGLWCLVLNYKLDFVTTKGEWLRQFCTLELCFLLNFQHLGMSQVIKHTFCQLINLMAVSCLH